MIELLITKMELDGDDTVKVTFADTEGNTMFDWRLPVADTTDFSVGVTVTVIGRGKLTNATPTRKRAPRVRAKTTGYDTDSNGTVTTKVTSHDTTA